LPQGVAQGVDLSPARIALGSFEDNLSHATLATGVLMGQSIHTDMNGLYTVDTSTYAPQADARVSAPTGLTIPTTFRNVRVLGTQASGFITACQDLTHSGAVVWNPISLSISNGLSNDSVEDSLFIARGGPATHTLFPSGAALSLNPSLKEVVRSRFVNLSLWNLYTAEFYGHVRVPTFAQNEFENVVLGSRVPYPSGTAFIVDGPVLDDQGVGGFPGRWWSNDVPYFTQGNTCAPAPPASASSGVVCTGNYLGVARIRVGTGTGTGTPLFPEAAVRREVTGTPALGYPTLASGVTRSDYIGLPLPVNESVRLEFPTYTFTPRRLSFYTWSRVPGLSAMLKIPYPAGTTFSVSSYFEFYPPYGTGIRAFTAAASVNEVAMDAAGEKYFFDGAYLYLRAKSDYRGNDVNGIVYTVWVNATHPSLP
jgi:hypothetical protein